MPLRRTPTKTLMLAACLFLALPGAWLCAQAGRAPVVGNISHAIPTGPGTVSGRAGTARYTFGRHADTVLSLADMDAFAGQQSEGATFFHPSFQKMGRHYGLLTVFIKYKAKDMDTLHTKTVQGSTAAAYLRQHQKNMVAPTVLDGYGSTFFRPFTQALGRGYALLSVYIKYDSDGAHPKGPVPVKVPFLRLHGNISYTFDQRSQLGVPFESTNFQQHNEQVYADAVLKGRYPFRAILNSRQSNSPYFRDYTDLSLQFDRNAFRQRVGEELAAQMAKKLQAAESPAGYDALAKMQRQKWGSLKAWLESPARRQETVQEREAAYREVAAIEKQQQALQGNTAKMKQQQYTDSLKKAVLRMAAAGLEKKITGERQGLAAMAGPHRRETVADSCSRLDRMALKMDSIAKMADSARFLMAAATGTGTKDPEMARLSARKDSALARLKLPTGTEDRVRAGQKALDSLYKKVSSAQRSSDSLRNDVRSRLAGFSGQLGNARSAGELDELAKKTGGGLARGDKQLLALDRFDIGRSTLSCSDLTANNISISGLNVEYSPSYYAALAVGSVDYRSRDFAAGTAFPKQDLLLGRFGWGNSGGRSIILTAYTGTKNSFNGHMDSAIGQPIAANTAHILGYSLEGRYRVGRNTELSLEAAKSSVPNTAGGGPKSLDGAFRFSDHNNEAWSARLKMELPATQSSLDVFYRQVGASFQSYSIFSPGTRQESWGLKWRQYLWKRQLSVTAQVRKNGFDNPLLANTFNSSIVFKGLQATLRIKKWPVLSAGYLPSSQLVRSPDGSLSENIYSTLTSSAFYTYRLGRKQVSSSLLYTKFYNRGTDTGFTRYSARDILFTHGMDIGRLRSQSGAQYTEQPNLRYWTLEQQVDIGVGKCLTAGIGGRAYRMADGTSHWGGLAQAALQTKGLGGLRLRYDKGYLPNGLGALLPNDWGRLSWFRVF